MSKTLSQAITDLASATTPLAGTEYLLVVQSGTAKKCESEDVGGGGGAATVTAKTTDFTANDASGTIYITNAGETFGTITATLTDSAVGTTYRFLALEQDTYLKVVPPSGHSIYFTQEGTSVSQATNADGLFLATKGGFVEIVKIDATTWAAPGIVRATVWD